MTQIIKIIEPLLQVVKVRDQPTMIVQIAPVQINTGGGGSKQESLAFSFGDVTTQTIYQAQAGERITRVDVTFDIAFNVASTLSVGDGTNTQRLMDTGQNYPLIQGVYSSHPSYKYLSNTDILLTLNAGMGAAQGSGVVIVYYE